MKTYRLYTETKGNLVDLVVRHLPNATILNGIGVWQSNKENSTIIEYISNDGNAELHMQTLARIIKKENKQEAILLTVQDVRTELL